MLSKPDLKKKKDEADSDEDSSDWVPKFIDIENPDLPYIRDLCKGLYSESKIPGGKPQESINESKW